MVAPTVIASRPALCAQVASLQRRLYAVASTAAAGGPWDPLRYRRLSWRWEVRGVAAILTPLAALALMVVKPGH